MENNNLYFNYLKDLIAMMKEKIETLKKEDSDEFVVGQLHNYYEVFSLMRQQALAFGLDLQKLGLKNLKLEDFLCQSEKS